MNLMQTWKHIRPTLAPNDGGAPGGDPNPGGAPNDPPSDPPSDPPAGPDFGWYPEQFRADDNVDHDGFRAHYEEMAASQAIAQEALQEVPENATDYDFAVPEDIDYGELELPKDFAVDLRTDDEQMAPLFEAFGDIMHKHNLPKAAAGEFMGLLARYEATRFSQNHVTARAEYEALGPTADARISNISRALDNRLPPDQAAALKGFTGSAAAVKAMETLLRPRGASTSPSDPPPEDKDPLVSRYPTSAT